MGHECRSVPGVTSVRLGYNILNEVPRFLDVDLLNIISNLLDPR